jgi:hypothetical protein
MQAVQEAIKQVSEGQFAVRGKSSPDFSGGTLPTASSLPTPVTDLPRQSTTFSTNGERVNELRARPASRGRVKLLAGAIATLAVVGGWVVWSTRQPAEKPVSTAPVAPKAALPAPVPAPAKAPDPKKVKISVDTHPGGARVVRVSNGENLGTTPWSHEEPAGSGTLEIRLDKDGYESASYQIPLFADSAQRYELKQKPRPPRKHTPRAGPEEPAKL